jgi:hypothetical protein
MGANEHDDCPWQDATKGISMMTRLFSGFAGVCLALMVMPCQILAQRRRDDITLDASGLRMATIGACDVAR